MLYGSKIVLCLLLIPKTLYYVDFFNSFLVDLNFKVTGFIFVFSFKNSKVSLLIFQRKFFFFLLYANRQLYTTPDLQSYFNNISGFLRLSIKFVSSAKVEMIH